MTGSTTPRSPCTQVCRIDERSGLCEGCLRTLDEIAAWPNLSNAEQRVVWRALAQRRAAQALPESPAS